MSPYRLLPPVGEGKKGIRNLALAAQWAVTVTWTEAVLDRVGALLPLLGLSGRSLGSLPRSAT